jgi:glycosyltransferase involved in cell wall biosynthesis
MMRPVGTLFRSTLSRRLLFKRLYVALLDRPALRRVDAIHVTTEAERTETDRLSLDLEERARVVPPPWRSDAKPPDRGANADRPTVLFLSRLHPKKNVAGLIEAWTHVVDAPPDAQL